MMPDSDTHLINVLCMPEVRKKKESRVLFLCILTKR